MGKNERMVVLQMVAQDCEGKQMQNALVFIHINLFPQLLPGTTCTSTRIPYSIERNHESK